MLSTLGDEGHDFDINSVACSLGGCESPQRAPGSREVPAIPSQVLRSGVALHRCFVSCKTYLLLQLVLLLRKIKCKKILHFLPHFSSLCFVFLGLSELYWSYQLVLVHVGNWVL